MNQTTVSSPTESELPSTEALRTALYEARKSKSKLKQYALGLARDGRYGAAIVWLRRALEANPNSQTLRTALADALLRREHWNEGWRHLDETHDRPELTAPTWNGRRVKDGALLVYLRADDPVELQLIGLSQVDYLGRKGYEVICECPKKLYDQARKKIRHVEIINGGKDQTDFIADGIAGGRIKAQIPLAHVALRSHYGPQYRYNWLDGSKADEQAGDIEQVAWMIKPGDAPAPFLTPDCVDALKSMTDATLKKVHPEKSMRTLKTVLSKVDCVLTDDGAIALTAGALGKFVILVLPPRASWWWGERSGETVLNPNIRLLRCRPDTDARNVARQISYLFSRGRRLMKAEPYLHSDVSPQPLAECLDFLSMHLNALQGGRANLVALTGGTRNNIYRLTYPGGDKVVRLGRFPPNMKDAKSKEIYNMVLAGKAGLTPRLFYCDPLDGTMLSEYVDGAGLTSDEIRTKANAVNAAHLLRRVQSLAPFQSHYDIFRHVDDAAEELASRKNDAFLERGEQNKLIQHIKGLLRANQVPDCPTHNDPLSHNFITTPDRMVLIDWECSGMGDPHWEVAALYAQAVFSEEVKDAYLFEYFGREDHPATCRIHLFEAVCRYYWWTSALLEKYDTPEGADDTSWQESAQAWGEWLDKTLNSGSFEQSMKEAETYRWHPSHAIPPGA